MKEKVRIIVRKFEKGLRGGDIAGNKYSEELMGPLTEMLGKKYDLPEDDGGDESHALYTNVDNIISAAEDIAIEVFAEVFAVAFTHLEKIVLKDVPRK